MDLAIRPSVYWWFETPTTTSTHPTTYGDGIVSVRVYDSTVDSDTGQWGDALAFVVRKMIPLPKTTTTTIPVITEKIAKRKRQKQPPQQHVEPLRRSERLSAKKLI